MYNNFYKKKQYSIVKTYYPSKNIKALKKLNDDIKIINLNKGIHFNFYLNSKFNVPNKEERDTFVIEYIKAKISSTINQNIVLVLNKEVDDKIVLEIKNSFKNKNIIYLVDANKSIKVTPEYDLTRDEIDYLKSEHKNVLRNGFMGNLVFFVLMFLTLTTIPLVTYNPKVAAANRNMEYLSEAKYYTFNKHNYNVFKALDGNFRDLISLVGDINNPNSKYIYGNSNELTDSEWIDLIGEDEFYSRINLIKDADDLDKYDLNIVSDFREIENGDVFIPTTTANNILNEDYNLLYSPSERPTNDYNNLLVHNDNYKIAGVIEDNCDEELMETIFNLQYYYQSNKELSIARGFYALDNIEINDRYYNSVEGLSNINYYLDHSSVSLYYMESNSFQVANIDQSNYTDYIKDDCIYLTLDQAKDIFGASDLSTIMKYVGTKINIKTHFFDETFKLGGIINPLPWFEDSNFVVLSGKKLFENVSSDMLNFEHPYAESYKLNYISRYAFDIYFELDKEEYADICALAEENGYDVVLSVDNQYGIQGRMFYEDAYYILTMGLTFEALIIVLLIIYLIVEYRKYRSIIKENFRHKKYKKIILKALLPTVIVSIISCIFMYFIYGNFAGSITFKIIDMIIVILVAFAFNLFNEVSRKTIK